MNYLKDVVEYFTPVLSSSNFYEKGVLTPEEFVLAGDQLVYKCKTWSWSAGDPKLRKSYLPEKKTVFNYTQCPFTEKSSHILHG